MFADGISLQPAGAGFLLGLGFIFSIGPQNLQLIRSGAFNLSPATVATTGYLSEIVIVIAGLASMNLSLASIPGAGLALQGLGVVFLVWFGLSAILRRNEDRIAVAAPDSARTRRRAILAMLSVTWLNPLVYLEIMFLAGIVSSGFETAARWWFGLGFLVASAIKFYGWSLAGRLMHPWLAEPHRRAQFGLVSGCLLLCSATLLSHHIVWTIL